MTFDDLPTWNASRGIAHEACWIGWRAIDTYQGERVWLNSLRCVENGHGFTINVEVGYQDWRVNQGAAWHDLLETQKDVAELAMRELIANYVPSGEIKPITGIFDSTYRRKRGLRVVAE